MEEWVLLLEHDGQVVGGTNVCAIGRQAPGPMSVHGSLKETGMSTTPPGGEGVILEPGKANLRAVFPDGGSLRFFGRLLLELLGRCWHH